MTMIGTCGLIPLLYNYDRLYFSYYHWKGLSQIQTVVLLILQVVGLSHKLGLRL